MKQVRILASVLLIFAFSLTSCESFFEVQLDDQANIDEIFSQKKTTQQYLRHIYSYIPLDESPVNNHGWVVARSDEALFSWTQWVDYVIFKSGNYSSASGGEDRDGNISEYYYWPRFYKAITQCSTFMSYVDRMPLKEMDHPGLKVYMKAEARFLRAYYYFCLFRQYGPVFIWGDRMPDEGIVSTDVDRHTVDENINFIVTELDRAAEDLPLFAADIEGSGAVGRVTKGAALALKSRVLLYAASPLYNGAELYKGKMQNIRGDYLFPQEEDPTKWDAAAQAALDVINMNMYQLYEDATQTDPFRKGAASYQGVLFQPWNSETIWGWWYRPGHYSWVANGAGAFILPALPPGLFFDGYGGIAPSLKLVDSYPMWNTGRYPVQGYQGQNDMSRPIIDGASGYVNTGFTDNYAQPLVDDWAPAIKAHNSCVGRDPRYYTCLTPNGFYWRSRTRNIKYTGYNSSEATSPWSGTSDCLKVGYAWTRLYKSDTPLTSVADLNSLFYVYPAFRLAETYLNYAEACNEKPQRDEATALEYLNKVRRRVGLNDIQVAYPEIIGNKTLLRWCIQKERMVEFGMESMRHYDACRWMIADKEYPGDNWTLRLTSTTYEGSYERVNNEHGAQPAAFRNRDYLHPIHANQLAEMTNMTQNYEH